MKKKVLFFTAWYPSKHSPVVGIFVKKHALALKEAGVPLQVLALHVEPGPSLFKREVVVAEEEGVPTHHLYVYSRLWKLLYVLIPALYLIVKRYYKTMAKNGFKAEVVHANVIKPAGIIGYWLSKHIGASFYLTEHWSKFERFMRKNFFAGAARKALKEAKGISVVSHYLRQTIVRYADPDKVRVIPNVIANDVFYYAPKEKTAGQLRFLAIAHWRYPKQPHLFIEALERIQKDCSETIVLTMVGGGPLLDTIRTMPLQIELHTPGALQPAEVAAALHRSDYFVHASEVETFSVVVAEALSTGTPVCASRRGAIPELVSNPDLGLLTENTVDDWEKTIRQMIRTTYDPYQISQRVAGKYSYQGVGSQFLAFYSASNVKAS